MTDAAPTIDSYHQHEALDRAHVVASIFDEHLLEHSFVRADADLHAAASDLSQRLHDFYQQIGAKALGDEQP